MNRVWDYIGFAVWFAGLGYIVLWLGRLARSSDAAAGFARGRRAPRRRSFPCACSSRAVSRRRAAGGAMPAARAASPPPFCGRRGASRTYPVRQVKPRSHFGLRGMPD